MKWKIGVSFLIISGILLNLNPKKNGEEVSANFIASIENLTENQKNILTTPHEPIVTPIEIPAAKPIDLEGEKNELEASMILRIENQNLSDPRRTLELLTYSTLFLHLNDPKLKNEVKKKILEVYSNDEDLKSLFKNSNSLMVRRAAFQTVMVVGHFDKDWISSIFSQEEMLPEDFCLAKNYKNAFFKKNKIDPKMRKTFEKNWDRFLSQRGTSDQNLEIRC